MATKPVSGIARRWLSQVSGWLSQHALYQPIASEGTHPAPPRTDGDIRELISPLVHRMLISDSRYIATHFDVLNGVVGDRARWCFGNAWRIRYEGKDDVFRSALRRYWEDIDLSLTWGPTGFRGLVPLLCRLLDIDGDCFLLLTKTAKGWPQLQLIEAHRVGQPLGMVNQKTVMEGSYAGSRIDSGVILSSAGLPVAYRVLNDGVDTGYTDVSASNVIHILEHQWASATRGMPTCAAAMRSFYDLADSRNLQRIKNRINAALTLIVSNETGTASTAELIAGRGRSASTQSSSDAKPLQSELMHGGMIRYIRHNQGAVTAHSSNDPSQGFLNFDQTTVRSAIYSMGWAVDMLDPTKVGGVGARAFQASINSSIQSRRAVLLPYLQRAARFLIASLEQYRVDGNDIPLPALPDDWWRITFTPPPRFSVDEGRARQEDREDLRAGLKSIPQVLDERGCEAETILHDTAEYLEMRQEIAEQYGRDPTEFGTLTKPGDIAGILETDSPDALDTESEDEEKEPLYTGNKWLM